MCKLQIKPLTQEESRKQIIDLPPGEEEYEVFPTLLIHNEVQGFNGDENNAIITKGMTPEECHKTHDHYSLIFHGKDDHDHEISGVCNACVRPISTPCYSCSSTETGCRFLVHELCAKLPKTIPRKFHFRGMHLFTEWTSEFFGTFRCDICYRRCNGFGYTNEESPTPWSSVIADVECASAPRIIKHQSHHHLLHLMKCVDFDYFPLVMCCDQPGNYSIKFLYMCISCDFKIHIACALLPKLVSHEFDHHPLQLVTDPSKNLNIKSRYYKRLNHDYFCEFCEEDINLNFWFYYCHECDQSFHMNCIPSVGELSKYKFGGTIGGVSLSSHPHSDHQLTSVRMLTVGSQTCGICEDTIDGFEDDAAFQCSTCDFWIHWDCAEEEDAEDEDEDED